MELKTIIGFEDYKINKFGEIFSYKQDIPKKLEGSIDKNGYKVTTLRNGATRKRVKNHRVVAMAFISNPHNKEQVNHKDGNKLNNHVENLEWATAKENVIHSYKNGLNKGRTIKVICINNYSGNISEYNSIKECAECIGVHYTTISDCLRGKIKTVKRKEYTILRR